MHDPHFLSSHININDDIYFRCKIIFPLGAQSFSSPSSYPKENEPKRKRIFGSSNFSRKQKKMITMIFFVFFFFLRKFSVQFNFKMIFNLIFIFLIFGNLSKLTANPTTSNDDLFTINVTMHGYDTTKV